MIICKWKKLLLGKDTEEVGDGDAFILSEDMKCINVVFEIGELYTPASLHNTLGRTEPKKLLQDPT